MDLGQERGKAMQPYRIAVCEDEAPIREQLSGLCCSILSEGG